MNLLEKVSVKIHDLWMGWAKEMIISEPNISKERVERWEKKCFVPYEELSVEMKDLDRKFAKEILEITHIVESDPYLNANESFLRLYREYVKYGSLVVAFDFDNTVYDFHKKGHVYTKVIKLLRELEQIGCQLICFTANEDEDFVYRYCIDNDIPCHLINENPSFIHSDARKIYFNTLLDDRAGLLQTYSELELLLKIIKEDE